VPYRSKGSSYLRPDFYLLRSFLDDVQRIASEDYIPTPGMLLLSFVAILVQTFCTEDVLRVRVRTNGAEEHSIRPENGE
jgi:hypothetical protein